MQCGKLKTYMETGRVVFLPTGGIRPNPGQPRKIFQQAGLEELADSIRQHGILQPLSVRRVGTAYELIAGERRLRAAKLAGLESVPCIIMSMDEAQSGLAALIENLQRRDLDFIEEAQGLSRLMGVYGLSQEQTALRVGKSQSAVANKLRLLRHSPAVLEALRGAALTERHARALLKLPEERQKLAAIAVIAEQGMNVARAEQYPDPPSAGGKAPQAEKGAGRAPVSERPVPGPGGDPERRNRRRKQPAGDGPGNRPDDHHPQEGRRGRVSAFGFTKIALISAGGREGKAAAIFWIVARFLDKMGKISQ